MPAGLTQFKVLVRKQRSNCSSPLLAKTLSGFMIESEKLLMSNGSNPFADQLRPPDAVRLDSAADLQNPYAAPGGAVGEFLSPALQKAPHTGLWRYRWWIVADRNAEFPARCVRTNEPTEEFLEHPVRIVTWRDWLSSPPLTLCYALSQRARQEMLLLRKIAVGLFLVLVILIALFVRTLYLASWRGPENIVFSIIVAIPMVIFLIATVAIGGMGSDAAHPLELDNVDGEFRWFSGAGRDFLNSLPQWRGPPVAKDHDRVRDT
jgi:hypothetical protein